MDDTPDPLLIADSLDGLVHRLNNNLNAILLQAAVLLRKAPAELHEGLASIRADATESAQLLRPLFALRQQRSHAGDTVDLAALLDTVIAEHPEIPVRVEREGTRPLTISTHQDELRRLLVYLLRLAQSAAGSAPLRIQLCSQAEKAILVVAPPEAASWLDDSEGVAEPGDELARLAVRALTHRLNGQLDKTEDGCLRLCLE